MNAASEIDYRKVSSERKVLSINEEYAQAIIDDILRMIINSNEQDQRQGRDPREIETWNEEQKGVDWIHTEFDPVEELWSIINPEYQRIDFTKFTTVKECIKPISESPLQLLRLAQKIIRMWNLSTGENFLTHIIEEQNPEEVQKLFQILS